MTGLSYELYNERDYVAPKEASKESKKRIEAMNRGHKTLVFTANERL